MTSEALRTPTRAGWWLLAAAVVQVAAPAAQSLADVGQPGDGSDDLLITPAGWTFAIWGVIYLLAVAHAIGTIRSGTGTAEPSRFTRDLLVLYVGAAVWIAFSAVGESWLTAIALLVMLVVAVDAAHVAARPAPAEAPAAQTVLARTAAGLYAGWVSAAAFLNLGTAAIELDLLDGADTGWQIALLVAAAAFALAVLLFWAPLPGYAVAVAWALVGITVAVWGESTAAAAVAIVALVLTVGAAVVSRGRTTR